MSICLVEDGYIKQIFPSPPVLHPDLMAKLENLIDSVEQGMMRQEDGSFGWPPLTPEQNNAAIDAQIAAMEAKQARPLREIGLGLGDVVDSEGKTPTMRLQAFDEQIAALRAQRV